MVPWISETTIICIPSHHMTSNDQSIKLNAFPMVSPYTGTPSGAQRFSFWVLFVDMFSVLGLVLGSLLKESVSRRDRIEIPVPWR